MRSTEFVREAGPGGPGFIPTPAQLAARAAQGEKNAQGIKNFFAGAPQTGGTAVPTARDPAQQAGQGAATNDTPAASFAGQSDEFGGMEQPAAQTSSPVQVGTGVAPSTQTSTPVPKRAAPAISPAIVGYASSMGLYKNGKPDAAAIKAFQQKNGLTADGIIGPNTSGAILSAAKPGAAGSGRGGQGGPAAPQPYKQVMPPMAQTSTPAAMPSADPTTQSVSQRLATGPSLIDQGRARLGIPAGGTTPAAPVTGGAINADRRDFEESVDRMRRLSNMLKG